MKKFFAKLIKALFYNEEKKLPEVNITVSKYK